MNFRNRVILITGAGRGLGLAYARALGDLGATVIIHDVGADSSGFGGDPGVAEGAAAKLRESGCDALAIAGSLESRNGCRLLVDEAVAVHGRLDGFIHNAGWVAYQAVEEIEEAAFDHMMAVGAKAPLWLAQAAWPTMRQAGYGRIVLTTSCRALYPQYVQQGLAAYAAAKMAAVGIVNVLAAEGVAHGIVVNAVSPVAKTRMWGVEGEPDELRAADVAPGVAFLASDACSEGGWILRAANGQFHATRAAEAAGVDYPRDLRAIRAVTADEVAAQWQRIAMPAVEPR
ncbi:NAD(P)-dependent dehydrogenase (short-subunit alcohol dehydrogenase family) [Amaricoccus macauensis]|uniref:NAD(P)-dependent dehydrogenase (Short-subunit alcohol dehydrogenase family) n=1 Tax=Amaricoccus macauensis TaxID=57001 RepID=A0A840SUU2_9RHOB|nr:SDR family NAD(P)-dependent oxidoreductase [Amaricoccus macauensis]MBB5223596.1 NAD(P)-dependent dehydrogenase (short-subunit alcohol dehydrogenase family) [Amaricoccus macauensis]